MYISLCIFKRDSTIDFRLFVDMPEIEEYAKEPLKYAIYTGFISGSKDLGGLYMYPKKGTTRVELASMLMRFIEADHPKANSAA
ncbi:MAG: hypothetical protein HFE77_07115 [Clostridiales bacterium]|nr:hypothetical protein [Clostridiales bacterium]